VTALPNTSNDPSSAVSPATRPLFLMGNKRSGTSLLVRLLNAHPQVFVTREADVIWILYQLQHGNADTLARYEWDGSVGLQATLEASRGMFGDKVAGRAEIRSLFTAVQEHLLTRERQSRGKATKRELLWLGDKKPVQHCDPEIRAFLRENFPDAKYLHIIRHPTAVVGSMSEVATRWSSGVPPYWHGSPREILDRWTIHEEWVLDAKQVDLMPVHSLKLEDLALAPADTFRGVLEFLGLESSPHMEEVLKQNVRPSPNDKYRSLQLDFSARDRQVMAHYCYSDDGL